MALPEITNPTISQLHDLVNVNIANDVPSGIDPVDVRNMANSIINYLSALGAVQTPIFQGIIYNINIGSNNTHTSTHKSIVADTVNVTRDNVFAGTHGSIFKITGITGFSTALEYKVSVDLWSATSDKGQLDLDNNTEIIVSKISNTEFWIVLREIEDATQNMGVNWSVIAY